MFPRAPTPGIDFFGPAEIADDAPRAHRPLADKLRPRALDEVVGQDHLLGPEGTLSRMLARGSLTSIVLWGPPGVGKTTIARLLAAQADLAFDDTGYHRRSQARAQSDFAPLGCGPGLISDPVD